MFKPNRVQYVIRTCPSDDTAHLESVLNEMSADGWELYSMHEIDTENGFSFNLIFVGDWTPDDKENDEEYDFLGFKTKMERIMSAQDSPFELCKDIQRKIKEKRIRMDKIRSLIDSTSDSQKDILNKEMSKNIKEHTELKKRLIELISPDCMLDKLGEDKISISLSEELIDLVNPDLEANLISEIVKTRQKLTEELGYIIPRVKFDDNELLQQNEFIISVRGIGALKNVVYPNFLRYFEDELNLSKYPKNSIKDVDYITGKNVIWIERDKTKDFWIQGLSACEVLANFLEFAAVKYVEDILDYSDINNYIELVGAQNLFLIENIIPDFLSVSEIKYIITNLIKEKVSVKDIVFLFEKINDFAEIDAKEDLLQRLRISMARQISKGIANTANGLGSIQAFELSKVNLDYLQAQINDEETTVKLEGKKIEKLVTKIEKIAKKYDSQLKDIVIIVPAKIRHFLFMVLSAFIPTVKVVAFEEISYEFPLEILEQI